MAHEIVASIRVALPDDPQQMAEELSTVAGAWAEFLAAMIPSPTESSFAVNETRGKPGPKPAANGAQRQRKLRASTSGSSPLLDEVRGILRPEPDGNSTADGMALLNTSRQPMADQHVSGGTHSDETAAGDGA